MTDASAAPTALRLHRLRFSYPDGTTALREVDLAATGGEVIGLLGPNGCGKTTLLRVIARASSVPDPSISFPEGDSVALAPDRPVFRDWLSGRENARALLRLRGLSRAESEERASAWIGRFELDDVADRTLATYSRGTVQRLALALAFAARPGVLLLDEPLARLDPAARERFAHVLAETAATGTTTLLSTHDPDFAAARCDRVAFLAEGRILAIDRPATFLAAVGGETRIHVRFAESGAPTGELPDPPPGISERDRSPVDMSLGVEDATSALPRALEWLSAAGARVSGVEVREPGLRDAYFQVTGRALESETRR